MSNVAVLEDLEFDEEAHAYVYRGKPTPSVTTILAPITHLDHVPFETLEAARQFGTHVHKAADLLIRGQLDRGDLDLSLAGCIDALDNFLHETGAQVIESEVQIVSPTLGYAGTLDAIVQWGKDAAICLPDWKTGSTTPRTVGPQTAAYAKAVEDLGMYKSIKRRYCVRLASNGTYRCTHLDAKTDFAVFLSCLNVWKFNHGLV